MFLPSFNWDEVVVFWAGVSCYPSPCTKLHSGILFITFPPPNSLFFWLKLFALNIYYMRPPNHISNGLCNGKSIFLQALSELFLIHSLLHSEIYLKKKYPMLLVNAPFRYSLSEAVASVAQLIILRPLFILLNTTTSCFHMPEVIHRISSLFLYLNCLTEESLIFKSRMKCIHKQQFCLWTLEGKTYNKKIQYFFF